MFPRMPGVGSDTFSVSSGLSDLGLDHLGSSTDITSKASDADSESSDDESDNNQPETKLSKSQAVSFTTGEKEPRKGSGSSLSTTVVNETSPIASQNVCTKENKLDDAGVKDYSDKIQENDKDTDAKQRSVELENEGANEAEVETNEITVKTGIAANGSVQDTGMKDNAASGNENIRVNSVEDNSDDVFEENYESCDEGEESGQDKTENSARSKTNDIENADNGTASSDINNVVIENTQNAAKGEQTVIKKDISTKDETNKDKSVDKHTSAVGNTAENIKSQTETAGGEYESSQQDMRNIERPSISGAED